MTREIEGVSYFCLVVNITTDSFNFAAEDGIAGGGTPEVIFSD